MDKLDHVPSEAVLETREITIAGMGCDNCVRKLERALRGREGVKEARVDGIAGRATVTFDPSKVDVPALQEVIAKSGYRADAVKV